MKSTIIILFFSLTFCSLMSYAQAPTELEQEIIESNNLAWELKAFNPSRAAEIVKNAQNLLDKSSISKTHIDHYKAILFNTAGVVAIFNDKKEDAQTFFDKATHLIDDETDKKHIIVKGNKNLLEITKGKISAEIPFTKIENSIIE